MYSNNNDNFETFLVYNAIENLRPQSTIEHAMMMSHNNIDDDGNAVMKSTLLEYHAITRLLQQNCGHPNLFCQILRSMTPLHWEVAGREETMKSLAAFPVMDHGWTPLHCATLAGSTEMIDVILNTTTTKTRIEEEDSVCNSLIRDDLHTSVISVARETGESKILLGSTLAGSVEIVDVIPKKKMTSVLEEEEEDIVHKLNDDCHTAISIARETGNRKVLLQLLQARLQNKSEWIDRQLNSTSFLS